MTEASTLFDEDRANLRASIKKSWGVPRRRTGVIVLRVMLMLDAEMV
jgi:hypothetical protein